MSFSSIQITAKGRALLAKAQTGTNINFTRIKMGDGAMTGQVIDEMTDVINQKANLSISQMKVLTGGKAKVQSTFSNSGLSTGFYWREIAVFASDPDNVGAEIMYCYGNAGALADYIPAQGSQILERVISVITLISNATNVTATIDSSNVYITFVDAEASYVKKSLATAVNQFLVSTAAGAWAVKTVADIKTLLGLGDAAYKNTGTTSGTVAAGNHSHTASDVGAASSSHNHDTVYAAKNTVDTHMADTTKHITAAERIAWNTKANPNDTKAATQISASVAGLAGTEVQTILTNLFQYANNGKTSIANVVGGVTGSNTHQEIVSKITALNNAYNDLLAAGDRSTLARTLDWLNQRNIDLVAQLNAKGVSASSVDNFNTNIQKVAQILRLTNEKKWANGTVTANSSGLVSVNGLSFKPSTVFYYAQISTYRTFVTFWHKNLSQQYGWIFDTGQEVAPVQFNASAFGTTYGFSWEYYVYSNKVVTWFAIE